MIDDLRDRAPFPILYPCSLPAGQTLESVSVTGPAGRQQAEMVFVGPFDLTLRQAEFPPPVNPDPTGASRTLVDLQPNVRATFIQVNDGSSKALYHLYWSMHGVYHELQAVGPPLQQRTILMIARSLE